MELQLLCQSWARAYKTFETKLPVRFTSGHLTLLFKGVTKACDYPSSL